MAKKTEKSSADTATAADLSKAAKRDKDKGNTSAKKAKAVTAEEVTQVATAVAPVSFTEALRVGPDVALASIDARSTPAFDGDKAAAASIAPKLGRQISELQERFYAEASTDGRRSLLLVVQGMDTSGKGGIMRHVVGEMDPQGVSYRAFKVPTAEERRHPFLWRIRKALPRPGRIGVFDRSHYEDVLVVRVHELVPRSVWARRYSQINAFEKAAVKDGTTIVKVMLHISSEEQKARLMKRLERPDKHWKYNPGDVDERMLWPAYH